MLDKMLETYQTLRKTKAVAAIPGTPVPGHGVAVDTITGEMTEVTEETKIPLDYITPDKANKGEMLETYQTLRKTNTVAAIPGTPVPGHGVTVDTITEAMTEVTEETKIPLDYHNHLGGNEPKSLPDSDNFDKQKQSVQAYLIAEEAAGNLEILKKEPYRYCYDDNEWVCRRIINKPTENGGNISKIVRDNVSKSHKMFITDSMAKGVYSWWLDEDSFGKPIERLDLPHLVLFNNGYFDLKENCFVQGNPHSCEIYFSTKVNADYIKWPLSPLSTEFFENVCYEKMDFVLASNGILLSNVRNLKKAFFFSGPRNSGKTTMANFTASLIFPKLDYIVRAVPLNRLGGRFSPSTLVDAHFSWAGDIGATEFTRPAFDNFKILTGMDRFEAEGKFKDLRVTEPKCGLAFNCNKFPRFPLAWDFDGDDIDEGAGRNRIVLFHTRHTVTEEMRFEYKRKHGMTVEQVLEADRDAIASEMIRQAGRVYRGELIFPQASFEEVYCEGKTLKERFFYLVETQCLLTGDRDDFVPLQEIVAAYKNSHPDEILPYKDPIAEERAFGALLNYVIKLDPRFAQAKRKVPGYPNPVSCLIGCRLKSRPQAGDSLNILNPWTGDSN